MGNSTRRSFLKKIALTGTAFAVPRISIAQQNWQVKTVAGTGIAGYEFEGRDGLLATETPAVSYTHLTLPTICSV